MSEMENFERLQKRVKAAGGTMAVDDTGDWYEIEFGDVPDVKMELFRRGSGLSMFEAMLDSFEDADKSPAMHPYFERHDAVLCYISGNVAYFTTQPLSKQWGDDWDDSPYEHNAGEPYNPAIRGAWEILVVCFTGDYETPDIRRFGSFSVQDINEGKCLWLSQGETSGIEAGTSLPKFMEMVMEAGGDVYLPPVVIVSSKLLKVERDPFGASVLAPAVREQEPRCEACNDMRFVICILCNARGYTSDDGEQVQCPECEGMRYTPCEKCNKPFGEQEPVVPIPNCAICDRYLKLGWAYCPTCGWLVNNDGKPNDPMVLLSVVDEIDKGLEITIKRHRGSPEIASAYKDARQRILLAMFPYRPALKATEPKIKDACDMTPLEWAKFNTSTHPKPKATEPRCSTCLDKGYMLDPKNIGVRMRCTNPDCTAPFELDAPEPKRISQAVIDATDAKSSRIQRGKAFAELRDKVLNDVTEPEPVVGKANMTKQEIKTAYEKIKTKSTDLSGITEEDVEELIGIEMPDALVDDTEEVGKRVAKQIIDAIRQDFADAGLVVKKDATEPKPSTTEERAEWLCYMFSGHSGHEFGPAAMSRLICEVFMGSCDDNVRARIAAGLRGDGGE